MQAILNDPREDIYVSPGDVITVTREPQTFTAIGATGINNVLPFDAIGITLEQAIGKAGGLNDQRADAGGVFVIRFEQPVTYDQLRFARPMPGSTAEVPVIYRLDMRDPGAFFLARHFPVRNKDILFVSNAPAAEIQKVGAIVSTFLVPAGTIVAVGALARN
jgi:polysaccharide export outer membrane protein